MYCVGSYCKTLNLQNAVDPSTKGSFLPFDQSELMRHFKNISLKSLKIKSNSTKEVTFGCSATK